MHLLEKCLSDIIQNFIYLVVLPSILLKKSSTSKFYFRLNNTSKLPIVFRLTGGILDFFSQK